ncbi:MAG TPA: peptidylprolyl isomerase [Candidatus Saccharimonadales bacterium]|nr:peptidylprolyl isomerase [Candidatus Saccharimonadales bacterium]
MKKPRLPKRIPRQLKRRMGQEERAEEAIEAVPRITNDTVAEHREEVLSSARKYIYPLQHSRRRIVAVSAWLLATAIVVFLVYCGLALYKFQSTSGFMYDVTRVLPFPVAKAGPSWVSYESYLFELRRNMHYYETQQRVNFGDASGKRALARYKQQALQRVTDDAYVKQLAAKNHVSVSTQDVDSEVQLLKQQNRLGSNNKVFDTVLSEFWGWSENDFKRELKSQMLGQKVAAKLDIDSQVRAKNALQQVQSGTDFGTVASQMSDDATTKGNGGQYGAPIDRSTRDVPPQVTNELFKLQAGQTSGIIDTGSTLQIVKLIDVQGNKVHAAHIQINIKDIHTYIDPLRAKQPAHDYIKF